MYYDLTTRWIYIHINVCRRLGVCACALCIFPDPRILVKILLGLVDCEALINVFKTIQIIISNQCQDELTRIIFTRVYMYTYHK